MKKDFIPVEAYVNDKTTAWYMDVSKLSLMELISLKNELKGRKIESVVYLDAIINENINYNRQEFKADRREKQRTSGPYRNQKALIKKRTKGRK